MNSSGFAIATRRSTFFEPVSVFRVPQLFLDPRIRKIEGLMQRNLHLKMGLPALAAAIALSPSRFSHLFKAQTGLSPAQYLKSIRLQRAKDLLEGTHLSIKEVAGCVGLDSGRLGKDFRELYGVTPSQHRFAAFDRTYQCATQDASAVALTG
ncbi:MAG TPA: helix-turn-helix transcriptional regulator [Terriglobia bacterium]|nr:helix-turn-helix transcriptional regulator [Terriglobia bacterium]